MKFVIKDMTNPNIKTVVVHSITKTAYNVIGESIGGKFKVARCPYLTVEGNERASKVFRLEAFNHAEFISYCFNNSIKILSNQK